MSVQARIAPLSDQVKQASQLINRLSKLPSQLDASPSNPEEGEPRVELSAEIHQSLKEIEDDFELLRQDAEDQANSSGWSSTVKNRDTGRDQDRLEVAAQVAKLGEDLKIARTHFRKAQLTAKRNAEAARRKERELLFAGIQEGADPSSTGYGRRKGHEKLSQEELLLSASNDITAGLRRTHQLMSAELQRSQFAKETLENSTKDLSQLSETYTSLDFLLSSSRSLVSTLIHSQKSDTWYLESAFYILLVTIGWLVFRRVLYGPGWWLLYFPLRLLWKTLLSVARVSIGGLSVAAGTFGAKNQSASLNQLNSKLSTSVEYTSTARGKGGIPTFEPNMPEPSRRGGAGGQGAKMDVHSGEDKSMSDQVGEIAVQSKMDAQNPQLQKKQGTVLRERAADEQPNPKKRMWEEPTDDVPQGDKPRDEL